MGQGAASGAVRPAPSIRLYKRGDSPRSSAAVVIGQLHAIIIRITHPKPLAAKISTDLREARHDCPTLSQPPTAATVTHARDLSRPRGPGSGGSTGNARDSPAVGDRYSRSVGHAAHCVRAALLRHHYDGGRALVPHAVLRANAHHMPGRLGAPAARVGWCARASPRSNSRGRVRDNSTRAWLRNQGEDHQHDWVTREGSASGSDRPIVRSIELRLLGPVVSVEADDEPIGLRPGARRTAIRGSSSGTAIATAGCHGEERDNAQHETRTRMALLSRLVEHPYLSLRRLH